MQVQVRGLSSTYSYDIEKEKKALESGHAERQLQIFMRVEEKRVAQKKAAQERRAEKVRLRQIAAAIRLQSEARRLAAVRRTEVLREAQRPSQKQILEARREMWLEERRRSRQPGYVASPWGSGSSITSMATKTNTSSSSSSSTSSTPCRACRPSAPTDQEAFRRVLQKKLKAFSERHRSVPAEGVGRRVRRVSGEAVESVRGAAQRLSKELFSA